MRPEIAVALAKSNLEYIRDWPDVAAVGLESNTDEPMRVFDISDWISASLSEPDKIIAWHDRHGDTDRTKLGRHLPFSMFTIVLNREALQGDNGGVFVVRGDDDGLYVYCRTSTVPMLLVRFTPDGWDTQGIIRRNGGEIEFVPFSDQRVNSFDDAFAIALHVVERSCEDTRNIVSYSLNRTERKAAKKQIGGPILSTTIVHHICLSGATRERVTAERGDTVVPTPKRLHEVRAHLRHLRSGAIVRVKAHRRGKRGTEIYPRVYTVNASTSVPTP